MRTLSTAARASVTTISVSVTGTRVDRTDLTGCPVKKEVPRLPVTTPRSHFPYCTTSGWFSPSLTTSAWTAAGVASTPRTPRAMPRPFPYISVNVANVTRSMTATARATFLSANLNIWCSSRLLEVPQLGIESVRIGYGRDRDRRAVRVEQVRVRHRDEPGLLDDVAVDGLLGSSLLLGGPGQDLVP